MSHDIIVKDEDGADVTFRNIALAGSDGTPARWDVPASAESRGFRITAAMSSRDNGPKTARRLDINMVAPVARTIEGQEVVTDKIPFSASIVLPNGLTDEEATHHVTLLLHFLASPAVVGSVASGFAPR